MGMDVAIAARIRMITEAGDRLSGPDLLGFALDHAVTETGGLGGMVHLRAPGARSLLLTAVHGLIRPVARDWAEVEPAGASAPARAMAQGTPVWALALGTGDGTGPALPAGSGLLAVPLITPERVTGALSVLMVPAERPAPERWAAVEALTAWAAPRLRNDPPDQDRRRDRDGTGSGTLLADDQVSQALWHMSDAFFAVDGDWRITFVNGEAERLLGAARTTLGRTLWDAFARLSVDEAEPGLRSRYRRAAESGTPVGFEVRWPTNQRWYSMRLVPVPNGLTVYAADITASRAREAERAAAEHAAAERTARIGELTNALAQALTMRDVVNAIADRVLPPFGASGMVVQLIEGDVIRIAGAVGYPQPFLESIDGASIHEVSPVSEVYQTGAPAFVESAEEYTARYPGMAGRPAAAQKQAWAFLPLIVSGRNIG
ncbi:PAS domain-containing protein, partial [Streptomyces sp. NPDC059455]|uniref:PAS domain-containing protein n=1 Tax=Streptomyces sp. NPDC059455 TaxID=3346837 RepID=UPI00367CEBC9